MVTSRVCVCVPCSRRQAGTRGRRDHWESAFQKKRKSASKRAIGDFSENNYYLLGPVAFSPSHGVVLAAPSASNAGAEFLLTVSSPRIYLVRVTQTAVKKRQDSTCLSWELFDNQNSLQVGCPGLHPWC